MAKQRINKNVLVGLALFLFMTMVVLSAIMLNQLQRRDPKYFVELAEKAAQSQQWEPAALYYREAWQRSHDATHLVRLGDMLLNGGDVRGALGAWQQALVNQPDLITAHMSYLELLLEMARLNGRTREWEETRDAAIKLLDVSAEKTPQQMAFAHYAKGLALLSMRGQRPEDVPEGLEALREAAKQDPEEIDYPVELASQYVKRDRVEEGEELFRRLMEQHAQPGAKASKVRLVYGAYLLTDRKFAEAEPYFKESVSSAGNDTKALNEARLGQAAFLAQAWARAIRDKKNPAAPAEAQTLFQEAESILEQTIESDPDGYDAYLQLAILYQSAQRFEDVVALCRQRIDRGLSRKGIQATRNRLDTFRLMIHGSEARVAQGVAERDPGRREGFLHEAQQFVVDAKGEFPTHPRGISQAGRVKVARQQYRAALEDLRKADEAYRTFDTIDWENKIILAQVHLQLKESGAAKAVLDEVLPEATRMRPQNPLFWTVYAQTLFENNTLDRALAIVDRILLIEPSNDEAAKLKAAIYERQGKRTEAGRIIEAVTGDRAMRAILTARELTMEGKGEPAVQVLRDALSTDPADVRLISALTNELLALNRGDEARAVVAQAIQDQPDNLSLQTLGVMIREDLTSDQRDAAIVQQLNEEPDAYKRHLDLISFYLRQSDPAKTLEHMREAERRLVARDTPLAQAATPAQHRALLRGIVRLGAQVGDEEALIAARDSAVQHDVDSAGGKSILGLYHMARKEFDLGINAFRAVLTNQPTDSWTLVHLGQCLLMVGRIEEAVAAYDQALRISPNEVLAHRDLAIVAKRRGDHAEYQKRLAECERLAPNDPWVVGELVAKKEQADPVTAIQRREAELVSDPKNKENIQRLATLCDAAGDRAKADGHYARWLELDADDQAAVVAVTDYFRRTGRPEHALEVLQRFAASRPTKEAQANAALLIAEHLTATDSRPEIEKTLLAAADLAETLELDRELGRYYLTVLGEPKKALPWLNRGVERARTTGSPLLSQMLITRIVCQLHRAVNDMEGAKRDVAELTTSFPDDPRGLLWQSEVYARGGAIDKSIASLTEYLAKRPNDPYALYQRAQHYVANGRTAAAIEDLESVKRSDPAALEWVPRMLLAHLYARAGRNDLWTHELETLVADAPEAVRPLEELVNAYLRQNRARDADRIVTARLNQAGDKPDPRWLLLRGRVSMELGEPDKALTDLQRAAELSDFAAPQVVAVVDLYIQTGRYAEGVRFFQSQPKTEAEDPLVRSRYAILLMLAGDKEKAVDECRSAMMLAVDQSPEAVRAVTSDLRRMLPEPVDVERALPLFEHAPSRSALARANDRILTRVYRRIDRAKDATTVLDRLIQSAGGDAERATLLQEKGEVHHLAGEFDAARAAYEQSLRHDPNNWVTLNNLAYLLSDKLGESKAALAYAQKAVATVENPSALDTLGWIYVDLGEYSAAIAELGRAVRLDPNSALIHYHLGEAYRRNGQLSEAMDILQGARNITRTTGEQTLLELIERSLGRVDSRDTGV